MKSIIPEQSQSTIFDKLIQAAMDIFISEGEVLNIVLQIVFIFQGHPTIIFGETCVRERQTVLRISVLRCQTATDFLIKGKKGNFSTSVEGPPGRH